MRRALAFGFLVLLLTSTALADGPETGLVAGKVVNADGEALPGVQITLEGGRGQQVTVTNEAGTYRFSLVPPGAYTVKAALEGFTEGHNAVNVTAGGKADVDLTLRLETAETITVTSEAPMVDKFNVSAGSAITSEVGAQAAGENRTYYGVINMLPGVTSDAENGAIQGTRPQVNGSHFADNSVFIDGVDTSFARFGGSRVFVPTTATTEIALEAGGMSAEYGRVVGSTTNVIIKSGTNVFHGDFLYGRSDTDWNADWKDQPKLDNKEFPTTYQNPNFPVTTPRPPYPTDFLQRLPDEKGHSDNFELGLGGPIVKDKAWFFVAYSENDTLNLDKTLDQEIIDASFDFRGHHRQAELPAHPVPPALGLLHRRAVEARLLPHALARSLEPDAARPRRRPGDPELELVHDGRLLPRDQARHPDLRREQVPGGGDGTRQRRHRPGDRGEAAGSPLPRRRLARVRTGPATTSRATGTAVTTAPGTTAGSSTTGSA